MAAYWPQITWCILAALAFAVNADRHGELTTEKYSMWLSIFRIAISATLLYCGGFFNPAHADIPAAAARYRLDLTRAAHTQWGLDAPVASLAAQVHQESGWNPSAVSAVGAQGMAQFMPSTAVWWCGLQGQSPAQCQPSNPTWALRSLVGYDKWLFDRVAGADDCNRMAFALSAYNGGLGWVNRDKALAKTMLRNPAIWFDQVALVNAGRSAANFKENRDYPRRILLRYEPSYAGAGWGRGACTGAAT